MKINFTACLEALASPGTKGVTLSLIGMIACFSARAFDNTSNTGKSCRVDAQQVLHMRPVLPGNTGSGSNTIAFAGLPALITACKADGPLASLPGGTVKAAGAGAVISGSDSKASAGAAAAAFNSIKWGTAASQPYTVTEAQGKAVNGKLYVFGGFDSQKPGFTPTSRAYSYDPTADSWEAIASMPPMNGTGYGGVTHAGFATDGTDIYFAGGYTSNSSGTGQIFGTKEVWKYTVSEDSYERLPDLPVAIAAGQLEFLDGRLHHIGGTNAARTSDLGNHYVLQLDNLAAGWKSLAQVPAPRQHAGSAVYGDKIYYIGGQTGHDSNLTTSRLVHQYDHVTNTWAQVADLPVPSGANGRGHITSSVIVVDDRIVVLGGETSHNSGRTNMVSAYTPATNTWENLTPLPQARYSGVAALLGKNLYYTGGSESGITYKGVPEESESQQQVTAFTLVNADTRSDIQALADGAKLNLATLQTRNLNIRANTSPSTVGSVVFDLSGTQSKSTTESGATYELMDDAGAWTPAVGSYTLKATPYTGSDGGGTAGTALTVAFTVINHATDTFLISDITAGSGRSYALAELVVGVKTYTDRTYQVTSIPDSLAGALLVQTPNDDKKSKVSELLTLDLSQQATVYVAYDPRATTLPAWLSDWQKLPGRIGVDDPTTNYMELYSKTFPAGPVSLGGNLQSPAAGAESNYFVVVQEAQAPLASPEARGNGKGLQLKVFPNPNAGANVQVEISSFDHHETVTVTLHDMAGRVLRSESLVTDGEGSASAAIPVEKYLSQGIYLIKAQSASGHTQAKLVVE